MFIGLFALNIIYVIIWLLTVLKYGWKHLSTTPKCAGMYAMLTCGKSQPKSKEEPAVAEIELQEQDPEVDSEKQQDLQKLEIFISYLQDRKKELHNCGNAACAGEAAHDHDNNA